MTFRYEPDGKLLARSATSPVMRAQCGLAAHVGGQWIEQYQTRRTPSLSSRPRAICTFK